MWAFVANISRCEHREIEYNCKIFKEASRSLHDAVDEKLRAVLIFQFGDRSVLGDALKFYSHVWNMKYVLHLLTDNMAAFVDHVGEEIIVTYDELLCENSR